MKLFTTACLAASFLLCFVLVWLFGQVEIPHQTRAAKLRILQEMQAGTLFLMLSVIGAGVGAVIVVRRARQIYRDEAARNMNDLVEETRRAQKPQA